MAVKGAADADVEQPPGVAKGDGVFVDLVSADSGVGSSDGAASGRAW